MLKTLKISQIKLPNRKCNKESIEYKTLLESITRVGLLNPIVVEKVSENKYLVVDGLSRINCLKDLSVEEIDAQVKGEIVR